MSGKHPYHSRPPLIFLSTFPDFSRKFDPAIAVTAERASLSVHCQHHNLGVLTRRTVVDFSFDRKDVLSNAVCKDGKREYRMTKGKMTVAVTITSQLQSTTSEICPRFRLLVIGKTGVGKSSLISQAFKINENVSAFERGKADINKELTAPQNKRFVLHDSEGFEPGDNSNFEAAKEFIRCRRERPELKDKIHAVWLCLSIPHAGARLLESGVKKFLESRKEILGDIPIIVVFTKHDVLVSALDLEAMESYEDDEAALENHKRDELNRLCIQPLQDVAGSDILHATVSTKRGYENTVQQLIALTTTNVEKFVNSEAALAMMIAQRVDIDLKVKASIAYARSLSFWGLASTMDFAGFTMQDCLSVIHKDIVDVWNFDDPHCHLADDRFQALIRNDLDKKDIPNAAESFKFGVTLVGVIIAILAPVAAPVLPIVVPIATVALAKWAYDIYQQSDDTLRRIMTYIVDLTCIMQILFLLAPTGPTSRRAIKIAIKVHSGVGQSSVHAAIQSHVALTRRGGDHALEEIVRLIEAHSIEAEEVQDLRAKIEPHAAGLHLDEEW
ncbi:hypothetical protein DFH29DRAFT_940143 [Suillus ampliporus]|nr:hypothetical protein DFH29DRAFT_940143 [Suillus ampliporus]